MGTLIGISLVIIVLVTLATYIFARSWRSYHIFLAISLIATFGIWADYYVNTLNPETFHDVVTIWQHMIRSVLTALMISTGALVRLKLKDWPRFYNVWAIWGIRIAIFTAVFIVGFYIVSMATGILTNDKYQTAWCDMHNYEPAQCSSRK